MPAPQPSQQRLGVFVILSSQKAPFTPRFRHALGSLAEKSFLVILNEVKDLNILKKEILRGAQNNMVINQCLI
jgi:hypothetical protein